MTTATAVGLNRSRLLRWFLVSVVVGATTMALAGQWTSPYLWGFTIGISAIFLYASVSVLDDELARERFRPPSAGADAVALRWIRVSAVAAFVMAPLDGGRLHWGPVVPEIIRSFGLGLSLVGFWLVVDAMKTNRYFSPVIRIQDERGHRVVDQGPVRGDPPSWVSWNDDIRARRGPGVRFVVGADSRRFVLGADSSPCGRRGSVPSGKPRRLRSIRRASAEQGDSGVW